MRRKEKKRRARRGRGWKRMKRKNNKGEWSERGRKEAINERKVKKKEKIRIKQVDNIRSESR